MKRKPYITVLAVLMLVGVLSMALTACSSNSTTAPLNTPSNTPSAISSTSAAATASAIAASISAVGEKVVNIGIYGGGGCEAALTIADINGYYKKLGIKANFVQVSDSNVLNLLTTGKIDSVDGVLQAWLKPIQEGLDVRFTIGTQSGCMSAVVKTDSHYKNYNDLKGKTIGVLGTIGGGPMNYAYRVIISQGADPQKDFTWKAYGTPDAGNIAFEKGEVDALVTADTFSYILINQNKARFLSLMATDESFKGEDCCLMAFNTGFITKHPDTAKAVTKAIYQASLWVQDNKPETAQLLIDNQYAQGSVDSILQTMNNFVWKPGVDIGIFSLKNSIRDFKKTGIIPQDTDEEKLTNDLWVKFDGLDE